MFCSNCGKEVNENAVICLNCGAAIKNNKSGNKKGKGIASMVLGILGVFFALCAIAALDEISDVLYYYSNAERFGYSIGYVLIQSVFAIVGISLACSERKDNKNGFNTSGLWLAIVTFVLIAITFISTISM